MKRVPLKVVDMADMKDTLDYKDQIIQALRTPTDPNGVNYDEMSDVVPLLIKVKACEDDELLLEDAEHDVVVRHLKACKFRLVVEDVYTMMQEIIDAPNHVVEVKGKKKDADAN